MISVVMSVYNSENYLEEAILSILNQTYKNFEFIIINDGSTDRSLDIIEKYAKKDNRIKVISRENRGLIYSLNEGIKLSKGKYIVRMDSDDISLENRFQKQIEFMENNLDVGVCGTNIIAFDDTKEFISSFYQDDKMLKAETLFSSPFAHPSVIIRKEIIEKYNLFYDEEFLFAEDLELWGRMAKYTNFHNIKEPLLKYRIGHESITKKADKNIGKRYKTLNKIFQKQLDMLGIKNSDNKLHFYLSVNHRVKANKIDKKELYHYFEKLTKANNQKKVFDKMSLNKVLGKRWLWYLYYKKDFSAIFSKYFIYGLLGLKK